MLFLFPLFPSRFISSSFFISRIYDLILSFSLRVVVCIFRIEIRLIIWNTNVVLFFSRSHILLVYFFSFISFCFSTFYFFLFLYFYLFFSHPQHYHCLLPTSHLTSKRYQQNQQRWNQTDSHLMEDVTKVNYSSHYRMAQHFYIS